MTDVDCEIVEDMQNTPMSDVTDDSCELQCIEIVPLDRTESDDDYKPEFIQPVFVLESEVLQDVEPEPADDSCELQFAADDYNTEDVHFTMQVRSASTYALCL